MTPESQSCKWVSEWPPSCASAQGSYWCRVALGYCTLRTYGMWMKACNPPCSSKEKSLGVETIIASTFNLLQPLLRRNKGTLLLGCGDEGSGALLVDLCEWLSVLPLSSGICQGHDEPEKAWKETRRKSVTKRSFRYSV